MSFVCRQLLIFCAPLWQICLGLATGEDFALGECKGFRADSLRSTTPQDPLPCAEGHTRSQQAFQRTFCDSCFDEVFLERRNFDAKVELNKTIIAKAGTVVQSDGERLIADWLTGQGIVFRYDERFRILSGHAVRPDFYLPELDVYVEYWGMDTTDYKIGMLKKQQLYQQQGKRLISVYPADKSRLDSFLRAKLGLFGYQIPESRARA